MMSKRLVLAATLFTLAACETETYPTYRQLYESQALVSLTAVSSFAVSEEYHLTMIDTQIDVTSDTCIAPATNETIRRVDQVIRQGPLIYDEESDLLGGVGMLMLDTSGHTVAVGWLDAARDLNGGIHTMSLSQLKAIDEIIDRRGILDECYRVYSATRETPP